MASRGKKAERLPKKKHPCHRDCEHFLEVAKTMNGVMKSVLCSCTGQARVRAAPPKTSHISCPDHPLYKPRVSNGEKQALVPA